MKSALLLIDFQNDYFKNGHHTLDNSDLAAANAKNILNYFRENNLNIIHVMHVSMRRDATFFLPETCGVEIVDILKPRDNEKVIIKHKPNSFQDTELHEYLKVRDITKVYICGMMTHMCVDSTVRAAKDYGFEVVLIADGCATCNLKIFDKAIPADMVHDSMLAAMNYYYASVIKTADFFDALP